MNNYVSKCAVLCVYIIIIISYNPNKCYAQNTPKQRYLTGVVRDVVTGTPLKKIKVFTSFTEDETDDNGTYILSLDQCSACNSGESIKLRCRSELYGISDKDIIISSAKNQVYDIYLKRNPDTVYIQGIVTDVNTFAPLSKINIKIVDENFKLLNSSTTTDYDGTFTIAVYRNAIEDHSNLRIYIYDPLKNYKPNVEIRNIKTLLSIALEPTANASNIDDFNQPELRFANYCSHTGFGDGLGATAVEIYFQSVGEKGRIVYVTDTLHSKTFHHEMYIVPDLMYPSTGAKKSNVFNPGDNIQLNVFIEHPSLLKVCYDIYFLDIQGKSYFQRVTPGEFDNFCYIFKISKPKISIKQK